MLNRSEEYNEENLYNSKNQFKLDYLPSKFKIDDNAEAIEVINNGEATNNASPNKQEKNSPV